MQMNNLWIFAFAFGVILSGINAFPERGKWTFDISQDIHYVGVSKSMFSRTNITLKSKTSGIINDLQFISHTCVFSFELQA